jgi:hypothetical protein
MLPQLKGNTRIAFAALVLLLGATSPVLAAPPLGQVGIGGLSPAHSVHSQRGALNLSMPAATTSTIAQPRPQRFEEPGYAPRGPQDWSLRTGPIDANEGGRSRIAFAIHWHDDTPIVSPKVASLARNFRHNGLPIVHLWQSGRNLLAIGVNPRGKPGIYFTQQLPD